MKYQLSPHELIDYANQSMRKANYSDDYMSKFEKGWKDLRSYLDDNAITCFSREIGGSFLEERYSIQRDAGYNKLKRSDQIRRRAMSVLYNCLEHEKTSNPKSYYPYCFAPQFEESFTQGDIFIEH